MTEARIERRLAAIVCADVVGYSRLVGNDEAGAIAAWRAHREAILPLVAAHGGRLFGTRGDELMLEFASVVESVACAIAIQQAMQQRGAGEPETRRFRLRIGINIGDIIAEGADLLGEGVNIAARLEALAEPGSICVADAVRLQVQGKLPVTFDDLGPRTVKNIRQPVHAWRVRPADSARPPERTRARSPRRAAAMAGLALLILLGGAALATRLADVWPWSSAAPHDRVAIMVLPFDSPAGNDQEYLSDGITEDIITALSKRAAMSGRHNLQVIGRSTAFSHKGRKVDVRRLARDLSLTHVLVGSVRRDGSRLRISAELIEAWTGRSSWAERYDHEAGGVFDIQDDVTGKVVGTLIAMLDTTPPGGDPSLSRPSGGGAPASEAQRREEAEARARVAEERRRIEEARRQAERTRSTGIKSAPAPAPTLRGTPVMRPAPAVYDLVLQARALAGKDSRASLLEARALLLRATVQEPRYVPALLALADGYLLAYTRRWAEADGAPEGLEAALQAADAALALMPDLPAALAARAAALTHLGRHTEARAIIDRVLIAPDADAMTLGRAAALLVMLGEPAAALDIMTRTRPLDPMPAPILLAMQARGQFLLGRDGEAEATAATCAARAPAERDCLEIAVATLARQGKAEAARATLARLKTLDPAFAADTPRTRFARSYRNAADLDTLIAALRKVAG